MPFTFTVPPTTLNLGMVVSVPVRSKVNVKFAGEVTFSPLMFCRATPFPINVRVACIGSLVAAEAKAM